MTRVVTQLLIESFRGQHRGGGGRQFYFIFAVLQTLLSRSANVGVAQIVFLGKPGFCPLAMPERGRVDKNGENDEFTFYPLKTRASLLRPPKATKMTKMAGVAQAN